MISVVCWKWRPHISSARLDFSAKHVNVLRNMVERHYQAPHRFICVTDDPKGLDAGIDVVKLWKDFASVQNPHGWNNPSCYRRLRAFAPDIKDVFGERFVSVDLDTVIVNDVRPLWDRTEEFVIWGETDRRSWYNGSMWLMTAGARKKVLEQFDPQKSPRIAKNAGRFGSDQGWISYLLGPGEATWTKSDGVYSYRVHLAPRGGELPDNARIVMFHGKHKPWSPECQQLKWVRTHWR